MPDISAPSMTLVPIRPGLPTTLARNLSLTI
jgi:hypothetical protein